ncbi:MAG: hypothetical protein IJ744_03315 [Lachnospiraceae bacterium]|nr:hypothetical protein [Lachnospiraceae bacterium]
MKEETSKFSVRDLALYGLLIAIMEVSKHALDFLPNVELISLLVILYTLHLGKRTLFLTLGFTLLEIFYWGPHTWVIMYLYVWPFLVFLTLQMKKHRDEKYDFLQFAVLSGLFGLFFGAMCSLVYLVIGGPRTALSWWVAGIPYDLIHAGANFVICLILFRPLDKLMGKVKWR